MYLIAWKDTDLEFNSETDFVDSDRDPAISVNSLIETLKDSKNSSVENCKHMGEFHPHFVNRDLNFKQLWKKHKLCNKIGHSLLFDILAVSISIQEKHLSIFSRKVSGGLT